MKHRVNRRQWDHIGGVNHTKALRTQEGGTTFTRSALPMHPGIALYAYLPQMFEGWRGERVRWLQNALQLSASEYLQFAVATLPGSGDAGEVVFSAERRLQYAV